MPGTWDPRSKIVSASADTATLGLALLGLMVVLCAPASASSLSVIGAAAAAGNYGLRVTVGSGCSGDNNFVVPDGSISGGTFEGCSTVSAGAVEVSSGTVTFRGGRQVILKNGFSVASGASFTAQIDSSLPREAFVGDHSPVAETTYSATFSAKIDNLSLGSSEEMELFTAYDSLGTPQLRVMLKFNAMLSEKRMFVEARQDNGSFASTAGNEALVSNGWHTVQINWSAASGVGQNDGQLDFLLDDVAQPGLSSLDNDLATVDFIRWGGIGVEVNTTGSVDLDEFTSSR